MARKPVKGKTKSSEKSGLSAVGVEHDLLRRLQSLDSWPRAPFTENGGIGLLYDFVNATDPNFPSDDRERKLQFIEEVHYAFKRYLGHEARTLDEAFNVQRPAGYQASPARKERQKKGALVLDGRILREAGAMVDADFWKVLGEIHGVGKGDAKGWYYEFNKGVKCNDGPLPERFRPFADQLNWADGKHPVLNAASRKRRK